MSQISNTSTLETLKAKLLCRGFRVSEPMAHQDATFIHGTVLFNESLGTINTLNDDTLDDSQNIDDATDLSPIEGGRLLHEDSGQIFRVLSLGELSDTEIDGSKLGDYFSLHSPRTLFCAPVRQCIFITMGNPCLFCTFESGRIQRLDPKTFERMLTSCTQRFPEIESVAVGGGTPILTDMGAEYYSILARIAKRHNLSVSVEIVPPPKNSDLDKLIESEIDSLIMSIEIWDDEARAKWCLGKGQVPKSRYIEAWKYANQHLGKNRTSSVLLIGAESLESTWAGCQELVRTGVLPTVLPLRVYPTSRFKEWKPVDQGDYLTRQRDLVGRLQERKMSNSTHKGCAACGGCSLEGLLMKLNETQKDRTL